VHGTRLEDKLPAIRSSGTAPSIHVSQPMPRAILVLRYATLFVAALCAASVSAASDTYEGELLPNGREAPIRIVLQMEELGGFLTGRVKVSSPLNGNSPIEAGRNVAGYCNLSTLLTRSINLRLYGSCDSTTFEGRYTVYYTDARTQARGTFRLTRKVGQAGKGSPYDGTESTLTLTACVKASTRCLNACPRGDNTVEYLCANHCRSKLQTCKAKVRSESVVDE
jgi:hypothetical protein